MHDSRESTNRINPPKFQRENSTKPSSTITENKDEPIPSFLKAMTCYESDPFQSIESEKEFLSEEI